MWRPEGWEELLEQIAPELLGYEKSREMVEAGADAMLKAILPVIEREIKAHTSDVSAQAIIGSELWSKMVK